MAPVLVTIEVPMQALHGQVYRLYQQLIVQTMPLAMADGLPSRVIITLIEYGKA